MLAVGSSMLCVLYTHIAWLLFARVGGCDFYYFF